MRHQRPAEHTRTRNRHAGGAGVRRAGHAVVGALALLTASRASADPITWFVDPGVGVAAQFDYFDGARVQTFLRDNTSADEDPRPGFVRFTPPDQANVRRYFWAWSRTPIAGWLVQGNDLTPRRLDDLAPFTLPGFAPEDPGVSLFAQVEVASFLGAGNPFLPGQTFVVTAGGTPLSSFVTFLDVSALPWSTDPLAALQALGDPATSPRYTGTVRVTSGLAVAAIPEPSTLALVGAGAVLVTGVGLRRARDARPEPARRS